MTSENKRITEPSERMAICRKCVFYERKFAHCKKCSCWMNIKTQKPEESCPIGKW